MQDLSTLKIQNIADPWDNAGEKWNLIDGATVSDDRTLEADVVIIGTGAGGGVSAEILSAPPRKPSTTGASASASTTPAARTWTPISSAWKSSSASSPGRCPPTPTTT